MEVEEQKPKDIILERRIKQETSNFFENFEEEPIEEHTEIVIPKQETNELLQNVKEEPIDEKYSVIVPKHEDAIEPPASYTSNNPVQNVFNPIFNEDPQSIMGYRCSVCLQMQTTKIYMKDVTMGVDKLVTIVGCILNGSCSLDQARLFMSNGGRVYICYLHFFEAINKICNVLNIKNTNQMSSCSSKLMTKLMITVNALYQKINTSHFCGAIHDFVQRNIPQKRKRPNKEEKLNNIQKNHCIVCTQHNSPENMKYVSLQHEKAVLMIGCILRGGYTLEQAQLFISRKGSSKVCHIHFLQSIDVIYKFLNISKSDKISSCSTELLANLMITVNKLSPSIVTSQFCFLFNKFVTRNKKFLDRVFPSIQMEFEEQKPKNVVDGEVKQETYDFLENVKEEPIEEEELSDLIIPKQETQTSLESLKEESINEEHSRQENSKLEKSMKPLALPAQAMHPNNPVKRFFILKKKVFPTLDVKSQNNSKPSNKMEFEEQRPTDAYVDNEIKQEADNFSENVKEPINEEYFDQIVPKLEEVSEQPTSNVRNQDFHANNPIQKFFIDTQKTLPNLNVEPQASAICHHRCSICLRMQTSSSAKNVAVKVDKLVMMVGYVLRSDYTFKRAQLFMSKKCRTYICHVHFSEALNEIYKFLNIENLNEITLCSSELMHNLMVTVNVLSSQIDTSQFCDIIHDFVRRNISQDLNSFKTRRCSVCRRAESSKSMKHVTLKDEELVIMVGCVLRGEYTVGQARSFISQKKYIHICHAHLSETTDEIYKFLNIKNLYEIYSCSAELLTNLMITVKKLCPQVEPWQFQTNLKAFFTRNERFMQNTRRDMQK